MPSALLPTPQAHAASPKTPEQVAVMRAKGNGVSNLNETVVNALLPTPNSRDWKGSPGRGRGRTARSSGVPASVGGVAADAAGRETGRVQGKLARAGHGTAG